MATINVVPNTFGKCAPRDVVPTRNRKIRLPLSSQYVGVSQDRKRGGWSASIVRGDVKRSKWFHTEREAADQRREWEEELDGPMAGATPATRIRFASNGRIKVQAICPDGAVRMCEQASKQPVTAVPFPARCWVYGTTVTGYLKQCNGYWHFVADTSLSNADIFDAPTTEHKPQRTRLIYTRGNKNDHDGDAST
jgi:hypothetical protein